MTRRRQGDDNDESDVRGEVSEDLTDIVPATLSATRMPPQQPKTPTASYVRFLRRPVVIVAGGFTCRGVLQAIDEAELYVRGEDRWHTIALADVTSLQRADAPDGDDVDEEDDL
jgi:hypothetical protein